MVRFTDILEAAMLQYLHDKGVDAVEIVWYDEFIYTYPDGGWDCTLEISYRMGDGHVITWGYDGTMGSFIEFHLGPVELSNYELDSDTVPLS